MSLKEVKFSEEEKEMIEQVFNKMRPTISHDKKQLMVWLGAEQKITDYIKHCLVPGKAKKKIEESN